MLLNKIFACFPLAVLEAVLTALEGARAALEANSLLLARSKATMKVAHGNLFVPNAYVFLRRIQGPNRAKAKQPITSRLATR